VIVLAVGGLILVRVSGPLYGLLFPIDLPVPKGAHQIEHVKPGQGAEYWIYRTTMPGEDVAKFYEKQGGTCRYTPKPLETGVTTESSGPYGVAQCTGKKKGVGSGVGWEVYIHEGYPADEGPTIFRLYKYRGVD
jgi:hypothetical protein